MRRRVRLGGVAADAQGATGNLAAAGSTKLTLRFSTAEQRRFGRLLKPGQTARATITVRATDKAGRTSTAKRIVAAPR